MKELIQKIEQWASDRNIIKGSTPLDQSMKLFSEFGELADNVGKDRDCRDDIGDVFVVLTIMCRQIGGNISELISEDYKWTESPKELVLLLIERLYEISWEIKEGIYARHEIETAITILRAIAQHNGYGLEECIKIAYNDIKDRKGLMHNGVFVKEDDEAYASIIKSIESNCE